MKKPLHFVNARRQQQGQSATEFLIVLPVLIFLVFGVLQWALIYQARSTLNHAAFLSARAGSLNNGSKASMQSGLAAGLTPLFAASANVSGYVSARAKAQAEVLFPSNAQLEVINPTKQAMTDFGRKRLDQKSGTEIPNDTLMYRTTNPGPKSKISVQDANILHLRVTYCYRLIVPLVNRMIHAAANAGWFSSSLDAGGMSKPFGDLHQSQLVSKCPSIDGPRIQLRSEAIVRMQSPFFSENLQ